MKRKFSRILGVGLTLALLASLVFSVPVSANITQPSVSVDDDDISADPAQYTILFNITADLPFTSGDIIIEFPTGTDVTPSGVTVAATSGIGSVAFGATTATSSPVGQTLTVHVPDWDGPTIPPAPVNETLIGAGAMVQVIVSGIGNPDTPDDYTLDVSTSAETTVVTSATYEIGAPGPTALPGIVSIYNPGDILMTQTTGAGAIAAAITAAGEDYTIMIGPGTYSNDTFATADDGVTFVSTGGVENTILEIDVLISNNRITLDGLTIVGGMDYPSLTRWGTFISGSDATIKNCVFEKSGTSTTTIDEVLLVYGGATSDVIDSTFDTTLGSTNDDVAIGIGATGLTVSGNTFTLDKDDIGVGIRFDATVKDNVFTGSSGAGVGSDGGDSTISGNTFDGLDNAILLDGAGTVTIKGNTITNSTGDATGGTHFAGAAGGAIDVESATKVIIVNNDISDTDEGDDVEYAVHSNAAQNTVFVVFNNITGNAMNVDAANALDATHNWWGDADGPDSDSYTTAADTSSYLGASVTGAAAVVGPISLDAKTDAGVKVSGATGASIIGAASYSGNPQESIADALAFFDVYVTGTAVADPTLKFYAGDENSKLYAWSAGTDIWVEQPQAKFSAYGGYVYATVDAGYLAGTPFVVVDAPAAPDIAHISLTAPSAGSTSVAVTNTPFTWTSVADADSYMVALSANYDLSSPIFREFPTGTAYTYAGTLHYDTPYYWQVLASGAGEPLGKSDVGTFTTMAEPAVVVPPAPTYTCPQDGLVFSTQEALTEHWNQYHGPAARTYTCPEDGLVFSTQEALAAHWNQYHAPAPPEATPAYIWVIIGVGAVLVVGVLVLIIRTRRVV